MGLLNLSEEERTATLRRAIEIARQETPAQVATSEDELELYLQASEEAGIPRAATLQALRERLLVPIESFQPGDLAFAPSTDGRFYVAKVIRTDERGAIVRFDKGGELPVALSELRPLGLVPGRQLQFYKDHQWWNGAVNTYDAANKQLVLSAVAYGTVKKIKLSDIRLVPETPTNGDALRAQLVRAWVIAGSVGVAAGWLLHMLIK